MPDISFYGRDTKFHVQFSDFSFYFPKAPMIAGKAAVTRVFAPIAPTFAAISGNLAIISFVASLIFAPMEEPTLDHIAFVDLSNGLILFMSLLAPGILSRRFK